MFNVSSVSSLLSSYPDFYNNSRSLTYDLILSGLLFESTGSSENKSTAPNSNYLLRPIF